MFTKSGHEKTMFSCWKISKLQNSFGPIPKSLNCFLCAVDRVHANILGCEFPTYWEGVYKPIPTCILDVLPNNYKNKFNKCPKKSIDFCVVKWNLPHFSAGSWHFGVCFILRHFLTWPTVKHSWVNEAWMRHHRPGSSYNTYFIIVEAFNYWKRWTIDEFCIWDSLPA